MGRGWSGVRGRGSLGKGVAVRGLGGGGVRNAGKRISQGGGPEMGAGPAAVSNGSQHAWYEGDQRQRIVEERTRGWARRLGYICFLLARHLALEVFTRTCGWEEAR